MSEPFRATITVPVDVGALSPNARMHWRERARLARSARQAGRLAWLAAGRPQASGRVRVSYLVRRGRRLDDDNVMACVKNVRDGVFCDALTPDDSPRFVTLGEVRQETGKQYRDAPEVVFEVVGETPGGQEGTQEAAGGPSGVGGGT